MARGMASHGQWVRGWYGACGQIFFSTCSRLDTSCGISTRSWIPCWACRHLKSKLRGTLLVSWIKNSTQHPEKIKAESPYKVYQFQHFILYCILCKSCQCTSLSGPIISGEHPAQAAPFLAFLRMKRAPRRAKAYARAASC